MTKKLVTVDSSNPPGQRFSPTPRTEIVKLITDELSDLTKASVGLSEVENLAPEDYPVSDAQAAADEIVLQKALAEARLASGIVPWGYCQSELGHGGWTGISDTDANVRSILQGIKDSHAQHVRIAAYWNVIEPVKGGPYNWDGLNRFFRVLAEFPDIEPLVCITSPAPTGVNIADFGKLCGAIAARYGSAGTISRRLKNYEIWNEQNNIAPAAPFNGAPGTLYPFGPPTYTALLISGTNAIRAADPQAFILMGGLLSTITYPLSPATHTDWLPSDWIEGVHLAGGDNYYDAINVHYYSGAVDFSGYHEPRDDHPVYVDLSRCRSLVDSYGGVAKPFWITEIGYPKATAGLDDANLRTEWLIEQVEQLVDLGFIDLWFVYNYQDTTGYPAAASFGSAGAAGDKVQPVWDTLANINAVTPKVPGNSITADKLAIKTGRGTAGVLNIAADGTLSIAPDAVGGSGGGSGGNGAPVVLMPARAAGASFTYAHGLNTGNIDVKVFRSWKPVTGSVWDAGANVPIESWQRLDKDNVEIRLDRPIADGELALSVIERPGTYDKTGPGKPTIVVASRGISSVNLTASGGADAGIGNAVMQWFRAPSGGGTAVKVSETVPDALNDAGLSPNTEYVYTARRLDAFGNPGEFSDPVTAKTLVPQNVVQIGSVVEGRAATGASVSPSSKPAYVAGDLTMAVAAVSVSHNEWVASSAYAIKVEGDQSGLWVRVPDLSPITNAPPDVDPSGQASGSVHLFYKLSPNPLWTDDDIVANFVGGSPAINPVNAIIKIVQYANVDQANPFGTAVIEKATLAASINSAVGDFTISVLGIHGVNGAPTGANKPLIGTVQGGYPQNGYNHYTVAQHAATTTAGLQTHSITGPSGSVRAILLANIRKAT